MRDRTSIRLVKRPCDRGDCPAVLELLVMWWLATVDVEDGPLVKLQPTEAGDPYGKQSRMTWQAAANKEIRK